MGISSIARASPRRGERFLLLLSPCRGDLHCYRWGPTERTHDSPESPSPSLPSNMLEISFVVVHIASDLHAMLLSATRLGSVIGTFPSRPLRSDWLIRLANLSQNLWRTHGALSTQKKHTFSQCKLENYFLVAVALPQQRAANISDWKRFMLIDGAFWGCDLEGLKKSLRAGDFIKKIF